MKLINKFMSLNKNQRFLLAAGIFLLIAGIASIMISEAIISNGVPVRAVITDIDGNHRDFGEIPDGINDYDIEYEYEGKTYKDRILNRFSFFDGKHEGDSIYIYINPENPQEITTRNHSYSYLMIFAGIVAVGAVYIMIHKNEKPYKNYE